MPRQAPSFPGHGAQPRIYPRFSHETGQGEAASAVKENQDKRERKELTPAARATSRRFMRPLQDHRHLCSVGGIGVAVPRALRAQLTNNKEEGGRE
ncbi:hypothetical protein GW17_00043893, partial [Ensete ventricosum]